VKEIKTELLIIGAGPAGLGAAIYAARSALDFKIVEKFMAGGQIVTTEYIENYPGFKDEISGFDLVQNMVGHCRKFNIDIGESTAINSIEILNAQGNTPGEGAGGGSDKSPEKVTGKRLNRKKENGLKKPKNRFLCTGDGFEINTGSIILATGASPQRLLVEGENEYIGRGISFCATCDGALYRDSEVIVIGGGNTAIQEALFLVKFASRVYIVHRRNELRAVKSLQNKAFENPKIEFIWDSVVERFSGSDRLEEVEIKNVKTGKKSLKKTAGVFEYIGIKPNSGLLGDIAEIDENGFILTDHRMETSVAGIFAAGDVRNTPLRQVITAVADGAVAATFADKYLNDLI